jgi:hypothetical protein
MSPSGSWHAYFRYPPDFDPKTCESEIAPGVDVRGHGGMVIAPPSRKPGGGAYYWKNAPADFTVAEAPNWLLDLLPRRGAPKPAEPGALQIDTGTFDDKPTKLRNALRDCAIDGEKHKGVRTVASMLGSRGLPQELTAEIIRHACPVWDRNVENAIRSGYEKFRKDDGAAALEFLSTADFLARWRPKDFLLKPILEEGRLYTMTGPTGTGKTAVALLIALHLALGEPMAGRRTKKAGVIFLAGENPDDVRTRWLAMLRRFVIDPRTVDVRFIEGAFSIEAQREAIARHLAERPAGLVIVDTLQAFFDGDDNNNNVQMKMMADALRAVANLGPAFLNEVDGNLSLWGPPDAVELSWCGKFRGSFEPMHFAIEVGGVPDEIDKDGDPIMTATARVVQPDEAEAREAAANADLLRLLRAVASHPSASLSDLAAACSPVAGDRGWSRSSIDRKLSRLGRDGLIEKALGAWRLTAAGKRAVENA